MKTIRKLTLLLLLYPAITGVSAQEEGCTLRKSFRVNEEPWLKVASRYGNITVISTPSDSITVCATVSIQQDNSDLAAKSLTYIKLNADQKGDTVTVSTVFNEKFFSTQFRSGRKSFSVDYVIRVPSASNISIRNAFGDVTLDELSGYVNISLSNGDLFGSRLTRGNVKPVSQLDLDHVKADISDINWMVIDAKHCQSIAVEKAKALVFTTEFSKLSVEDAGSMVCKSRSDYYTIGSVKNIITEGTYSSFKIGSLQNLMQAVTMFGTVKISELKNGFNLTDLRGTNTPVDISLQKDISFICNISLKNTLLDFDLSSYPGLQKKESGVLTGVTGIAGKNSKTQSELKLNLERGILRIQ